MRSSRQGKEPTGTAFDAAARILAGRDHSCYELRQKLSQRGFEDDAISEALQKLSEYGYVDDERFARLVIRQNPDKGQRGLIAVMQKKGVPQDAYGPLLDEMSPEEEYARAAFALEKRVREVPRTAAERQRWRARLAGYLGRRGFSSSVSIAAINEAMGVDDDW